MWNYKLINSTHSADINSYNHKLNYIKKKVKIRLISKMFKLKKSGLTIFPQIHLSNKFFFRINFLFSLKKKKKVIKFYLHNPLDNHLTHLFIKKRALNTYTKRGLFNNLNIFLKRKGKV